MRKRNREAVCTEKGKDYKQGKNNELEKKNGWKKNKDNSLIVGRDLREQGKCLDEVYKVGESKYNERYAEGSGGWPQSAIKALRRPYLGTVNV